MILIMNQSINQSKNNTDPPCTLLTIKTMIYRAADPNDEKNLDNMIERSYSLSAKECLGFCRAFSTALNLVNAAEVHHRHRAIKAHEQEQAHIQGLPGPLYHTEDSVKGSIQAILDSNQATKEEIFHQLCTQKVELVLTAHPTEVNRRSVLRKYRKCAERLAYFDRPDLLPYEKLQATYDLQRFISSLWGMDEIRRVKPTPQNEAAGGLAIVESVLWDAVPSYLRKLDAQCHASLDTHLPLNVIPIKFASWIGGDRDGNPNVTPRVTKEVVLQQRLKAAKLLSADLTMLGSHLAISSRYSPAMLDLADSVFVGEHKRELYRRVLSHLNKRLVKTMRACEDELEEYLKPEEMASLRTRSPSSSDEIDDLEPIYKKAELLEPLTTMHESLMETGFELVADGLLVDVIRRLYSFGMTLVPLDIREESTKHTVALDAITRWLGIGSYAEWDEEARLSWLSSEISSKRPLFPVRGLEKLGFPSDVAKTLETFKAASELEPEALGAYVISQCQTASDVLAVMLLQKQMGMTAKTGNMMRVVPLFETLNDLTNAPEKLEELFSVSAYVGAIKGKQEVMVGYSDSAKDAGRMAACWAQYKSQEQMVKVADKYAIELTFFHGKGGTVGRGGNPALYRAVLSHPPNTINGRFRVTEQGEMITQNYGTVQIAEHTLDIYTAAVMRESFTKHVEPSEKWKEQMERISEVSCADYRHLVREEPRFVPYFRQATPELELGSLNIGSRPAKRNPKGGIESLRAIPWTFAWTQTRTHLSAWLGVGAGLSTDVRILLVLLQLYSEIICILTNFFLLFCRMRRKWKPCRRCTWSGHGSAN
jgi:phosphoenolpyruvate carboxylase